MSRSTLLALAVLTCASPRALAAGGDGFSLVRVQVAPTTDRVFSLGGNLVAGHLEPYGGAWVHYAARPLVLQTSLPSGDRGLVDEQLLLQLAAGLGVIDRLAFELSFPVVLLSNGDAEVFSGLGAAGAGDLAITARANLYGTSYSTVGVGANLHILVPTGDASHMAADDSLRLQPEVVVTVRGGPVVAMLNLGVSVRAVGVGEFRGLELGHELVWGLGVDVAPHRVVSIGAEIAGRNVLSSGFADKGQAPIELLLGPKVTPWRGLRLDLAAGFALAPGYGAAQWRIVAGVSWAPSGPPAADTDGDGLTDDVDQCVDDPEDRDGHADGDGCPDPDNDQDGVADASDRCPMVPGRDGHLGCPKDVDSDGDGLVDAYDRCPAARQTDGGRNGCPPGIDTDGDGKQDVADRCPLVAEPKLAHGCPPGIDSDGDGVPEQVDKCPYVKADTVTGCPGGIDSDGDGLLDAIDPCPLDGATTLGCPPTLDSDGDGLLDVDDPCPEEAGSDKVGCPTGVDSDGDGLNDDADRCPYHPQGDNGRNGCPAELDSDGDGLLDMFDKCPQHKAEHAAMGCPDELDTDGDGLVNELDRCPRHVMGPGGKHGCPLGLNRDGDPVDDVDDHCPLIPQGAGGANGCPAAIDDDRDGIPDAQDKCPSEKEDGRGAHPKDGCAAGVDLVLKDCAIAFADNVFFSSGTDTVKAGSARLLEDLSRLVTKARATELIVEGHTDSKGGKRFNARLSRRRAEAVVAKLRQIGMVKGLVLTARGLGASQPVASNKTRTGRAKNRRVSFRVLGGKCAQRAPVPKDSP